MSDMHFPEFRVGGSCMVVRVRGGSIGEGGVVVWVGEFAQLVETMELMEDV